MSGGEYEYKYGHIYTLAEEIERYTREHSVQDPNSLWEPISPEVQALRKRFTEHLQLVAEAAHAIEWVDSGDWGRSDEVQPIQKVLNDVPERRDFNEVLMVLLDHAEETGNYSDELRRAITARLGKLKISPGRYHVSGPPYRVERSSADNELLYYVHFVQTSMEPGAYHAELYPNRRDHRTKVFPVPPGARSYVPDRPDIVTPGIRDEAARWAEEELEKDGWYLG